MKHGSGRTTRTRPRGARIAILLALPLLTGGAVAFAHAPGVGPQPNAVTAAPATAAAAGSGQVPMSSPASSTSGKPAAASAPEPDVEPGPSTEDLTARAAAGYIPDGGARTAAPVTSGAVDYGNLLSVATGYLQTRLTYHHDDPAGYAAAVMAPTYSTQAFAERSTPTGAQLARLAQAQQTSTVAVGAARASSEAPTTSTTAYLTVDCTVTTTYRGGSDAVPAEWTLRLVLADGQWRVDGVLSTG